MKNPKQTKSHHEVESSVSGDKGLTAFLSFKQFGDTMSSVQFCSVRNLWLIHPAEYKHINVTL